jgi:Fe-S-cluster containining protein
MRSSIPEIDMFLVDSLPGFKCRKCARCCAGKLIPLFDRDIERLKARLGDVFYEKTNRLERSVTGARFKMRMVEGKCILLNERLCRHYELRPNTCRRHPFIATGKHRLVASTCPSVDWSSSQSDDEVRTLSEEILAGIDSFMERRQRSPERSR